MKKKMYLLLIGCGLMAGMVLALKLVKTSNEAKPKKKNNKNDGIADEGCINIGDIKNDVSNVLSERHQYAEAIIREAVKEIQDDYNDDELEMSLNDMDMNLDNLL